MPCCCERKKLPSLYYSLSVLFLLWVAAVTIVTVLPIERRTGGGRIHNNSNNNNNKLGYYVHAFTATTVPVISKSTSFSSFSSFSQQQQQQQQQQQHRHLTIRRFSNNNNNNDNNTDNLLLKRFKEADKIEIRNDATLVACYVLCRFFVYDIRSGAKTWPGFTVQDWIWLTGTFSSAVVLVLVYVVAGLVSRGYEPEADDSNFAKRLFGGPAIFPIVRSLINVVLCCPVWLAIERLLGFGPANIGGETFSTTVLTGFVGLGSFMVVAKTLTSRLVYDDTDNNTDDT